MNPLRVPISLTRKTVVGRGGTVGPVTRWGLRSGGRSQFGRPVNVGTTCQTPVGGLFGFALGKTIRRGFRDCVCLTLYCL